MAEVTLTRDQFMQLLELAEEALDLRDSEFSSNPTVEEHTLMEALRKLANSEVEPDD